MEPRPHKLTQPDTLATHGALNFTTADARHLRGALFTAAVPVGAVTAPPRSRSATTSASPRSWPPTA